MGSLAGGGMLRWLDSCCLASGENVSEDVVGYLARPEAVYGWVIDGVTGIPPALSLAEHLSDAAWYALQINVALSAEISASVTERPIREVVSAALNCANAAFLQRVGDAAIQIPHFPSASLVVARVIRVQAQYELSIVRLGDCSCLWRTGCHKGVHAAGSTLGSSFDADFDILAGYVAAARDEDQRAFLRNLVEEKLLERRRLMNQPGGYSIVAPNYRVEDLVSDVCLLDRPLELVLLSDGAARLIDKFKYFTEQDAHSKIIKDGAMAYLSKLRQIERQDSECIRWPRLKATDDASIFAFSVA